MQLSRHNKSALIAGLLGLVIIINGCDTTETTEPVDNSPKPSFTAVVNGQPWSATGTLSADERMYSQLLINGSKLSIKAFKTENNLTDAFELRLTSPKEGLNLLQPEFDQPDQTANLALAKQDSMYFMTAVDSGQVFIDQWDETTTRISGTFWFTATNNQAHTVSVASGQFKDIIVRK
jgi:hypothetical protein